MLKISRACGTSATNGNIAKIIGTAPLKPTQDTKILSFLSIFLKGSRHKNTVSGRETNIIKKLMISPGIRISSNSEGFTSKPNVKNKINCDNQAKPSKKFREERF